MGRDGLKGIFTIRGEGEIGTYQKGWNSLEGEWTSGHLVVERGGGDQDIATTKEGDWKIEDLE
jgi:hypothetical protein